jgi:hypothetical protein
MTVKTDKGVWVVPPLRAVWIPAHTLHQIEVSGLLSMRTLYIEAGIFPGPSQDCCVIAVTPLLRELILYTMNLPLLYPLGGKKYGGFLNRCVKATWYRSGGPSFHR